MVVRTESRSRSPKKASANGMASSPKKASCGADEVWPKGSPVQFFHMVDPVNSYATYIAPTQMPGPGPRLLQSHGWIDGTLDADYSPKGFELMKKDTWPSVLPRRDVLFADRHKPGVAVPCKHPRRVNGQYLRKPTSETPLLSVVLVRWGGEDLVAAPNSSERATDGDWGIYGAPACDEYMSNVISKGLTANPLLGGGDEKKASLCKYEVFSLFVRSSKDVEMLKDIAHWIPSVLKGVKTTAFWMMWPAEWEDCRGSDYAAYIERHAFFGGIRALEAVGLRTGFPHPADQYETITSKSWMATLSLQPDARLPAATKVSKANVLSNSKYAAKTALATLDYIRSTNPFPIDEADAETVKPGEYPAPSEINKSGVKKGVVKLGWSWEARYVTIFHSEEDLAAKLSEMFGHHGCYASSCIVQEWVDFDFEMRLYFFPPEHWTPTQKLQPTRVECNAWSGSMENGERRSFHKLNKAKILEQYWSGDEEAYKSAKKQAINIAQFLLGWLLLNDAQPVPMIRLDFMLKRLAPGRARVVFGEYCEMGACCLGWEEGPPTVMRAAVDAALR